MKKIGKNAAYMLLLAGFCLTGCFGKKADSQNVVNAAADGVLTVGIVNGNDTYAYSSDGTFSGAEPAIMDRLGQTLEAVVEYKEAEGPDELMSMLDAGEIDIAAGRLTLLEAYTQSYLPSRNYAKRGLYLITSKNRYVDTLAGFHEGTIGLSWQIPAYAAGDIPYLEDQQQTVYEDISEAADDIENGVIQAALCTEREAVQLLEAGAPVSAAELRQGIKLEQVFYLKPEQTELRDQADAAINSWLDELADPEKEE